MTTLWGFFDTLDDLWIGDPSRFFIYLVDLTFLCTVSNSNSSEFLFLFTVFLSTVFFFFVY